MIIVVIAPASSDVTGCATASVGAEVQFLGHRKAS